jgi:hypothetical protein
MPAKQTDTPVVMMPVCGVNVYSPGVNWIRSHMSETVKDKSDVMQNLLNELCTDQVASFDHSFKTRKAQQHGGVAAFRVQASLMCNSQGTVPMSICTATAAMTDPALVLAFAAFEANQEHQQKTKVEVMYIDKMQDASSMVRLLPSMGGLYGREEAARQLDLGADATETYEFGGETKVVCASEVSVKDGEALTQWLFNLTDSQDLEDEVVVGFDMEWVPSQVAGVSPGPVALVQMCYGTRCLLVRLHRVSELPRWLINTLLHSKITLAGVGVTNDRTKLFKDYEMASSY